MCLKHGTLEVDVELVLYLDTDPDLNEDKSWLIAVVKSPTPPPNIAQYGLI